MHFLVMLGFAVFVAIVFAGVNSETLTLRNRAIYALKVFGSFIGVGLGIAWLFYLFF